MCRMAQEPPDFGSAQVAQGRGLRSESAAPKLTAGQGQAPPADSTS